MKNLFKIFILLTLLTPFISEALIISEIMYDPEGTDTKREWIEVYNDSENSVDISQIKLNENDTNHSIKLFQGENILESNSWAIIADNPEQFLIDYPDFDGQLFDSAFSLSNSGETLQLVDSSGNSIDTFVYTGDIGAKNNGNSLQLSGEIIISASPTPGAENKSQSEEPVEEEKDDDSSTNISSHTDQAELTNVIEKEILKIGAGRERMSLVYSPIDFEAIFDKKEHKNVKFNWFFGDGYFRSGKNVSHTYKREGIYNVVLHAKNKDQYAVSRTKVFVYKPELVFSATTTEEYGFEIKVDNRSNNEANIGGFKIKLGEDKFTFPIDTILEPNGEIIFDNELFNFDLKSTSTMEVFYPDDSLYQNK
ncbi:lamin tail domain-containing protein [Candidatus Nomurabacteria bacterium]|nr:lamin tail domain-containing protein [Candidatus Nomurabacteria bacterium]